MVPVGYTWVYGKKACSCIVATLPMVEERLREIGAINKNLSGLITQGSYNNSVGASAGTHSGGGVWDVSWRLVNSDAKLRAWRESGWAMYPRPYRPGVWPSHGHGIVIGCPHAADGASRQVQDYKRRRDGLAGHGPDPGPRVKVVSYKEALVDWSKEKMAAVEPKLNTLLRAVSSLTRKVDEIPDRILNKKYYDYPVKGKRRTKSTIPDALFSNQKNIEELSQSVRHLSAQVSNLSAQVDELKK